MKRLRASIALACTMVCAVLLNAGCQEPASPIVTTSDSLGGELRGGPWVLLGNASMEVRDAGDNLVVSTSTSDDGAFLLAGLPTDLSGTRLVIRPWAYGTVSLDFDSLVSSWPAGSEPRLILEDPNACAPALVRVTGSDAGMSSDVGIGGATVRLVVDGSVVRTTTAHAQGAKANLGNVPHGTYGVRVSHLPYFPQVAEEIVVAGCDSAFHRVHMTRDPDAHNACSGSVRARFRTQESPVVSHLTGSITFTNVSTAATINRALEYPFNTLSTIPGGTYDVLIAANGYAPVTYRRSVACGQHNDMEFTLQRE